MRKMMEGVVLYGTGKPAQLNGYSSGGKTGTAQKIDPATHTYSKTMHIASFAGIAPVNNPAIAVAVVMDNPKGALYYGTEVSAPVFAEVAQQVLEYLGVPHDIDVQAAQARGRRRKRPFPKTMPTPIRTMSMQLFAAVNDLPADDPLRAPAQPAAQSTLRASALHATSAPAAQPETPKPDRTVGSHRRSATSPPSAASRRCSPSATARNSPCPRSSACPSAK